MAGSNAFAGFDQHFAIGHNIKSNRFTLELRWLEFHFQLVFADFESLCFKELAENFRIRITKRVQKHGHRQFTAAVNTAIEQVFGIELKVQPGATIGNNAGRKQQFAGTVADAFIVVEKDPRRTVQLGDNDTLGTVNHERSVIGHQRHFAHKDRLRFNNLFQLALVVIPLVINGKTHPNPQRRGISHSA